MPRQKPTQTPEANVASVIVTNRIGSQGASKATAAMKTAISIYGFYF